MHHRGYEAERPLTTYNPGPRIRCIGFKRVNFWLAGFEPNFYTYALYIFLSADITNKDGEGVFINKLMFRERTILPGEMMQAFTILYS